MPLSADRLAAESWFLARGLPAVVTQRARVRKVWSRSAPALAGLGDKVSKMVVKEIGFDTTFPTIDSQILQLQAAGADTVFFAIIAPKFGAQGLRKIAELGYVIERHLQSIGLLKRPELDVHQRKMVEEKRAEFEARTKQTDAFSKSHFPDGAQLCNKCSTAAMVMMDGCMTCLNCGESKCG